MSQDLQKVIQEKKNVLLITMILLQEPKLKFSYYPFHTLLMDFSPQFNQCYPASTKCQVI